jgi:ankyrin repeat protein
LPQSPSRLAPLLLLAAVGAVSTEATELAAPVRLAQMAPTAAERQRYTGLHAAAARGDTAEVERLLARGADPNARDDHDRTPLHVAAFGSHYDTTRALVRGGADPNVFDVQRYDIVTIAAVQDDVRMVTLALSLGTSARNVTSPYDGTALIAAAHLGHAAVVRELIKAKAPLDHVNNLGWTALIEAVVLGDGGPRHVETVRALVDAGANVNIPDRKGTTPLAHARERQYAEMIRILTTAGGR